MIDENVNREKYFTYTFLVFETAEWEREFSDIPWLPRNELRQTFHEEDRLDFDALESMNRRQFIRENRDSRAV